MGAAVAAGGQHRCSHTAPTCDSSSETLTLGTGGPLETAHTSAGAQLDSSSLAKRNLLSFFVSFIFFRFLFVFWIFCFLKEKYSEDTKKRIQKREKGKRC